jgi:hypothetical protein
MSGVGLLLVGGIFQGFSRTLEMDPKKDPTGWGPKKKDRPRHNPTTVNERRGRGGQARMIERPDPTDYSIAVRRNRKPRNSWRWEIYRPGKSISVERSPDHFQTMVEATRAGKAALQRFVNLRATLAC